MANQPYHSETFKQPVFEQSVGLEDRLSQESQKNRLCHSERSEESLSDGMDYPGFRWYIQICPRIGITGGFELATDVFINTIPPETAAEFFRS